MHACRQTNTHIGTLGHTYAYTHTRIQAHIHKCRGIHPVRQRSAYIQIHIHAGIHTHTMAYYRGIQAGHTGIHPYTHPYIHAYKIIQAYKQTGRQTGIQPHIHIYAHTSCMHTHNTCRHAYRNIHPDTYIPTGRQAGRQAYRNIGKFAYIYTYRHENIHTGQHACIQGVTQAYRAIYTYRRTTCI